MYPEYFLNLCQAEERMRAPCHCLTKRARARCSMDGYILGNTVCGKNWYLYSKSNWMPDFLDYLMAPDGPQLGIFGLDFPPLVRDKTVVLCDELLLKVYSYIRQIYKQTKHPPYSIV